MGLGSEWRKLMLEALRSSRNRGHRLTHFKTLQYRSSTLPDEKKVIKLVKEAKCIDCGMTVQINTHPAPNEVAVGGEAVALNCPLNNLTTEGRE